MNFFMSEAIQIDYLLRKSAQIGDPYAMRRLYALRRECSFICARIVGQQTATAPSNFKNNPRRPFTISLTAAPSRALPLRSFHPIMSN
mgnify:CR=1 FL=1